ncbi:MAG TPA: Rieske (2Fe-2S) protein [Capsulimonadaceae bacterium]
MTRRKFLVTLGVLGGSAAITSLAAHADDAPPATAPVVYWANVGMAKDFPVGEVTRTVYPKEFGGAVAYVRRDSEKIVSGVSAKCTHRGCTVNYVASDKGFRCPCHGATYSAAGERLSGPARGPLPQLQAKIDDKGIVWLQSLIPPTS